MVNKYMENSMRSKLENKLAELEKLSPITNDEELIKALNQIIDETVPVDESDAMMIDEAVEMLLALENVDMAGLENAADEWSERYLADRGMSHNVAAVSALEAKLCEMDINNDEELKAALNEIIENTVPENEKDAELIDEAVEMLLALDGVDTDELDKAADAWGERYLAERNTKHSSPAKINRKSIRIKWLMPVAALLSILCITVIISYAVGVDVWTLTKEAYCSLTEKIEHFINGSSIISTEDYDKYQSLDDLIEKEDVSGVLLPLDLSEEYTIDNLSFNDLGETQNINMDILKNNKKIGVVHIKISYTANFNSSILTDIGDYKGYECQYDNVYQFQFDICNNHYLVNATQRSDLVELVNSMHAID